VKLHLCRAGDVPEGGTRGFCFGSGMELRAVLIVRKSGQLFGYVNSCPHLGTPLNVLPDRFLDRAGKHLLCMTHGALFRLEDGFCIAGPCAGKSLEPVALEVKEGAISPARSKGAAACRAPRQATVSLRRQSHG
jgi:nitrite reductase/ring-hydroxylating ferredoxin subunit